MGTDVPGDCAEKFKPLKLLGEGGFGRVYLAEQVGLGRHVAIKVLRTDTVHDDVAIKRFVEEGRITAQLSHPNVVRVIDAGAATGVPWLVYELVEGPSLADRAAREPLAWKEALDAACSVASALEEAHRHEIVHRDVKAENVLQTPDGHYKLADFGIAKWSSDNGVKTRTGFVVGTPTHMAPELIKGLQPSPASDIYALGVLLYELLTGRLPFDNQNLGVLMRSHLEGKVPTPTRFQPDLPPDLDRILKLALSKDPHERISTAREFREALERVLVADASELRAHSAPPRSKPGSHPGRQTVQSAARPASMRPADVPATGHRSLLIGVAIGFLFATTAFAVLWRVNGPREPVTLPSVVATASPEPALPLDHIDPELSRELVALDQRLGDVVYQTYAFKGLEMNPVFANDPAQRRMVGDRARILKRGIEALIEEVRFRDAREVRGPGWHRLAIIAGDLLAPVRRDRFVLEDLLAPSIANLSQAVQAPAGAQDFRLDFHDLMTATLESVKGKPTGRQLPRALAVALARYAATPRERFRDPAETAVTRSLVAQRRFLLELAAPDPAGLAEHAERVAAARDVLDSISNARAELPGPRWKLLAEAFALPAVNYTAKALPLAELPAPRVEAHLRDLAAILEASPPLPRPHADYDEQLRALETHSSRLGLKVRLPPAPWARGTGSGEQLLFHERLGQLDVLAREPRDRVRALKSDRVEELLSSANPGEKLVQATAPPLARVFESAATSIRELDARGAGGSCWHGMALILGEAIGLMREEPRLFRDKLARPIAELHAAARSVPEHADQFRRDLPRLIGATADFALSGSERYVALLDEYASAVSTYVRADLKELEAPYVRLVNRLRMNTQRFNHESFGWLKGLPMAGKPDAGSLDVQTALRDGRARMATHPDHGFAMECLRTAVGLCERLLRMVEAGKLERANLEAAVRELIPLLGLQSPSQDQRIPRGELTKLREGLGKLTPPIVVPPAPWDAPGWSAPGGR